MHKSSKATFVLPDDLLEQLRGFVKAGISESLSALVRESLELRARQLREEMLTREFEDAARDPQFMEDMRGCLKDFDGLLGDGLNE